MTKTQLHITEMNEKVALVLTIDELKLIDKYIELNNETQSVFDKIKDAYPQPKMTLANSGCAESVYYNNDYYYRIHFGSQCLPLWLKVNGNDMNTIMDAETERLLEGLYYNHIEVKKEKVSEWEPTPQTPKQVADGLKEAFGEAVKQGVVSSIKSKTLTDLIYRWWSDVFTTHSDWEVKTSIEDLVDQIELFLPKEQSAAGSQNAYVECSVEGFNDCLNKIKRKLR